MQRVDYRFRNLLTTSKHKLYEVVRIRRCRGSDNYRFTVAVYYNHLSKLNTALRRLKISKLRRITIS